MAQVQADTLDQDVKRLVISDWFATEWLMVAENDRDSYERLQFEAEYHDSIASMGDQLRNDWERLAEQVTELTAEHISPSASLFISQILQGWGSLPFDIIARQAKALHEESKNICDECGDIHDEPENKTMTEREGANA
jgi:hypothetical protein